MPTRRCPTERRWRGRGSPMTPMTNRVTNRAVSNRFVADGVAPECVMSVAAKRVFVWRPAGVWRSASSIRTMRRHAATTGFSAADHAGCRRSRCPTHRSPTRAGFRHRSSGRRDEWSRDETGSNAATRNGVDRRFCPRVAAATTIHHRKAGVSTSKRLLASAKQLAWPATCSIVFLAARASPATHRIYFDAPGSLQWDFSLMEVNGKHRAVPYHSYTCMNWGNIHGQ